MLPTHICTDDLIVTCPWGGQTGSSPLTLCLVSQRGRVLEVRVRGLTIRVVNMQGRCAGCERMVNYLLCQEGSNGIAFPAAPTLLPPFSSPQKFMREDCRTRMFAHWNAS